MEQNSIWQGTVMPEFPALEGDCTTEVLVIGGGIAGILCAAVLQKAGVDCILVEAERLCSGVTGGTTAKITVQHGACYAELIRRFGEKQARLYLQANREALEEYARLCRTIDCDFQRLDSCVYSQTDEAAMEREQQALERLGEPAEYLHHPALPFSVAGAVRVSGQAQFQPLRFLAELSRGLRGYEHTTVRRLQGTTAITDRGTIRAKQVIVATHFPFWDRHGSYFMKLYQSRSYVLALQGAPLPEAMYIDADDEGLTFRSWGDLLLISGCAKRTGKQNDGWRALETFAAEYYPEAQEVCRWATQDCMTLDGLPYIGQYSAGTPKVYVATGFNKWGMTSAMAAALLLRDLVQGKENPYAELFSPSRSILRAQLAVNGAESAVNLLTPTLRRCTHMGCALHWNSQERSWDCPCHGSRFSVEGRRLDGPAERNLKHP